MTYVPRFWKLRSKLTGGGLHVQLALVSGAAANADTAITGLKSDAQILGVIDLTDGADELANVTVVKAGAIRLSVDMSTKKLVVLYAQHHA